MSRFDTACKELVITMRNLLFIIMICAILAILSCSEDETECPVAVYEPSIEELEARVFENCYTLRDALEEYMDNNGCGCCCPLNIYSDTNEVGLTVIDYLPGGEPMENPFTGERTEPVDTIATEPGQTGYYAKSACYPPKFYINGFGESFMIVELSNHEELAELESMVIVNCFIVREAVMRFASLNGGVFPANVAIDTTPEGHTVISLLPDGVSLENPLTCLHEEPTDGAACTPGDTGYVPIVVGGVNAGYVITGCGSVAGITIFTAALETNCSSISIYNEYVYCSGDCCPD